MRVKATRTGYYNHKRMKPGQVFVLVPQKGIDKDRKPIVVSPEKQFSAQWMEMIDVEEQDDVVVMPKAKGKKSAKVVDEIAPMPSDESDVI